MSHDRHANLPTGDASISSLVGSVAYATGADKVTRGDYPDDDLRVQRTRSLIREALFELTVEKGFAAGFPLSRYYKNMENSILICVTEKRTKQQIGMLAESLEACL